MASVRVKFKDGRDPVEFSGSRPGGSYSSSVRYEGAFAIVTDVWGAETAWPASDILEIHCDNDRHF